MKSIQVVVIGYGHLGKWHCQKVDACEGANLLAIVETREEASAAAKHAHPHAKVVGDISEVIEDCDAVFIVTPTSTHFQILKSIIPFQKHIFCEKPICQNEVESQEIVELLKQFPIIKMQVGHSERFHPLMPLLLEELKQSPEKFSVSFQRVTSPKGRALDVHVSDDIMIHDIDILLHVLKKSPLNIMANGFSMHSQFLDYVEVKMELKGGGSAHFLTCREQMEEKRIIDFHGKQGHVRFDLMSLTMSKFVNGSINLTSVPKRDHLLEEHKSFYHSIRNDSETIVSAQDALRNVSLLKQIHGSVGLKSK
ncbi:MAG: Gfo/Idh/MocA family oxidoreductase [Bacteriovoracaceae bacterium]|nr:Gfo/Idh/MocA family oxidoreductase [Bacteriovoracaceae bacterium]